jgi:DtxR family transcriptional regulator, Mn-dependent transcriptional regulator
MLMNPPTAQGVLTGALEDYLETIYQLLQRQPFARVRDIAKAREVKAGSVSPALKRLADLGMVRYVQREYVTLTDDGEREARRVYARHRLLIRFFTEILQMAPAAAEKDACRIEHTLSDEAMDRMVRFFEYLSACPSSPPDFLERFHGCSIVHSDAEPCPHHCTAEAGQQLAGGTSMSVFDMKPGESGCVTQVNAVGAIRQRLLDMGILPDVLVELERVAPAGEPVWIRLEGSQLALRRQEAQAVMVSRS